MDVRRPELGARDACRSRALPADQSRSSRAVRHFVRRPLLRGGLAERKIMISRCFVMGRVCSARRVLPEPPALVRVRSRVPPAHSRTAQELIAAAGYQSLGTRCRAVCRVAERDRRSQPSIRRRSRCAASRTCIARSRCSESACSSSRCRLSRWQTAEDRTAARTASRRAQGSPRGGSCALCERRRLSVP